LIPQDTATMGKREILGMIRTVWQCEQFQRTFIEHMAALVRITTFAGGYNVGPLVLATARNRHHMIATQITFLE